MAETHQIVIIGGSFGGIRAAHGLLKEVLPKLGDKRAYKVVMISPSAEFYFKVGAPRAIVRPDKLPLKQVLVPIPENFKVYGTDKFEFVQAYVTSIDAQTKTLQLSTSTRIHYDSLIIASGTSFSSPLWSLAEGSEPLSAAIKDMHKRIPEAKSILIAGGGPVGVETAGELGEKYGGKKDITILSGTTQLLSRLKNASVGKDAERRLTKMGLKVLNDVKVISSTVEGSKTNVQLSNGTSMLVDVYIEAVGDKPNSKFVPEAWLDAKGFVKTNPHTLRLDVAQVHGVYSFGTVASYSNGSIVDTKFAAPALFESIRLDLLGKGEPANRKIIYKKIQSDLQIVPVGSGGGVGVIFGYKVPSFVVKMIKSKDFMVGGVPKMMNGTD